MMCAPMMFNVDPCSQLSMISNEKDVDVDYYSCIKKSNPQLPVISCSSISLMYLINFLSVTSSNVMNSLKFVIFLVASVDSSQSFNLDII